MTKTRYATRTCIGIIMLLTVLTITVAALAGTYTADASSDVATIIKSLEDQIGLLKWVGVGIITALAGTIAYLYRALEKAHNESREEYRSGLVRREEILTKTLESNYALSQAMTILGSAVQRHQEDMKESMDCMHTEVQDIRSAARDIASKNSDE